MFRIGEFAQIAQVSGRQLRFYDQLGLLQPAHTDPQTGYRYYSIRQLPRLNSILALKELGLSLEQIGPLLKNELSPAELRAHAHHEAGAGRAVAARGGGAAAAYRIPHRPDRPARRDRRSTTSSSSRSPATPFLSLRYSCDNMDEAVRMVRTVAEDGGRQIRPALRDKLIVVARNDHDDEKLDLEIGFSLTRPSNANVRIAGDYVLRASELPAVETMATIVGPGTNAASHTSFGAIGMWIEANGYEIAGPCREVFLEPVTGPPGFEGALVEIQFPVRAGRLTVTPDLIVQPTRNACRVSGNVTRLPVCGGGNMRRKT